MVAQGVFAPVFPTIPESSSYDTELDSLCRVAAWIGANRGSEAPVDFLSLLTAFLTKRDPVSAWFQSYTSGRVRDALLLSQEVSEADLQSLLAQASRQELPAIQPLFSTSNRSLFLEASKIANDVATPSSGDSPTPMGARHVLSAYAFRTPSNHLQQLLDLGIDVSDWQTRFMAFLRKEYALERWDRLINPYASPNPSEMGTHDIAAQVPNDTITLNLDSSGDARLIADTLISPPSGTLHLSTHDAAARNDVSLAQSSESRPSTVDAEGTVVPGSKASPTSDVTAGKAALSSPALSGPKGSPLTPPIKRITGPLVGRYTADDPDATADDLLNIESEAAGFARIVAARSIRPPLAIGIFGEWGSGKTFFMRKIQSQVETLRQSPQATTENPLFYSDIVQIRFNAWHYIETNLWASLVEYIFSALDNWIERQAGGDPKHADLVFNRLATAQQLQIDALEQVVNLRAQQHSAELHAQHARRDYANALAKSARLKPDAYLHAMLQTFVANDAHAEAELKSISTGLAVPDLQAADERLSSVLAEARTETGRGRIVVRSLLRKLGTGPGLLSIAILLFGFPLLGLGLKRIADEFPQSIWGHFFRSLSTQTAVALLFAAGLAQSALHYIRLALKKLSGLDARLQASIDQQVNDAKQSPAAKAALAAEQDLLKHQQAVAAADRALDQATCRLTNARQEFESGTARGRLNAFVRAKVTDGDYAKHLGIIASIRKDFVQLASLMHAANSTHEELAERLKLQQESALRIDRFFNWLQSAPELHLSAAEVASLFRLLEPADAVKQFARHREVLARHFEGDPQTLDEIEAELLGARAAILPRFSRIVLFIDDLDRCPPDKVVDVLQAVHLLLCFPLFVVFVAVDVRWVSRALHDRFPGLLATPRADGSNELQLNVASSDDYLEKIFQIPYWVRPMDAHSANAYVRAIAGADRAAGPIVGLASNNPALPPGISPLAPPGIAPASIPSSVTPGSAPAAPGQGSASVAGSSAEVAEALASGMSLTEWEIAALHDFAPYVGSTPRHAIRFVNIYRLIKTSLSLQALDVDALEQGSSPLGRALIPQLAIVTGVPGAGAQYFEHLQDADGQQRVGDFFSKLQADPLAQGWSSKHALKGIFETLVAREAGTPSPLSVKDLQYVAPTIRRYSFTAR